MSCTLSRCFWGVDLSFNSWCLQPVRMCCNRCYKSDEQSKWAKKQRKILWGKERMRREQRKGEKRDGGEEREAKLDLRLNKDEAGCGEITPSCLSVLTATFFSWCPQLLWTALLPGHVVLLWKICSILNALFSKTFWTPITWGYAGTFVSPRTKKKNAVFQTVCVWCGGGGRVICTKLEYNPYLSWSLCLIHFCQEKCPH